MGLPRQEHGRAPSGLQGGSQGSHCRWFLPAEFAGSPSESPRRATSHPGSREPPRDGSAFGHQVAPARAARPPGGGEAACDAGQPGSIPAKEEALQCARLESPWTEGPAGSSPRGHRAGHTTEETQRTHARAGTRLSHHLTSGAQEEPELEPAVSPSWRQHPAERTGILTLVLRGEEATARFRASERRRRNAREPEGTPGIRQREGARSQGAQRPHSRAAQLQAGLQLHRQR